MQRNKIHLNVKIATYDPSVYTNDHPKFIASKQMRNSLGHKGLSEKESLSIMLVTVCRECAHIIIEIKHRI